jgi:hypothetical protein
MFDKKLSSNALTSLVDEKKDENISSILPKEGRRRRGDTMSLLKDPVKNDSPDSSHTLSKENSVDRKSALKKDDDFLNSLKNDTIRNRKSPSNEPENKVPSPKFQNNNITVEKRNNANLSFSGNNVESSKRPDVFDYSKFDSNEPMELRFLKQKIDEETARYEKLLNEEREKNKKLKEDHANFIDELRKRQREELNSLEDKYKINTSSLSDDNKKLRHEIDKEILLERERLQLLHRSDIENIESTNKRNLEQQKKFFEEQNDTLKKQLQQQIEFNKLATKVEVSSKQLEEILNKFYTDKEKSTIHEQSSLENKEKYLKDYEDRLKETEKQLNTEKEFIMKMRQDFEMRELEKRREAQEERSRIEKEILRLQELQNNLKILEYNAKEKYEREKLELTQKSNDMKNETDTLKSEYNQKLSELEYQKKIYLEEKNYFEKFKDEAIK